MWPKVIDNITYYSYKEFLQGGYWQSVNFAYDIDSRTPKYCFVCSSDRFYLHHEDYSVLGHELEDKKYRTLVAICNGCHKAIHFDETGAKIPLKREFLKERRLELRKRYIRWKIAHLQLRSLLGEFIYRIFW